MTIGSQIRKLYCQNPDSHKTDVLGEKLSNQDFGAGIIT